MAPYLQVKVVSFLRDGEKKCVGKVWALVSTGESQTNTNTRRRLSIYSHTKLRFPKKLNTKQSETKMHESWVANWPSHPPAGEKVGDLVMAEKIYVN